MKKHLFTIAILVCGLYAPAQEDVASHYHDFDFWLGHWDVYRTGGDTVVASSFIASIMDSVGIQENYQNGNYKGTSLNKYNPVEDRWEQYYIDNQGMTLHLIGGLVDNKMILHSTQFDSINNFYTVDRITWTPQPNGSVRQLWDRVVDTAENLESIYAGETPNVDKHVVIFDGTYMRKHHENIVD